MSNYLHNTLKEGDRLRVFPPFGVFTLKDSERPVALISAGVGITPMVPMLEQALAANREIYFIHAAQNHEVDPFYHWLYEKAEKHPNLTVFKCYEDNQSGKADQAGRLDKDLLAKILPNTNMDVYYLGPTPFMEMIKQALTELGFDQEHCHYEFFGPSEVL